MRVCLDTSAYSHFKRGHAPAVEAIGGAREVLVPAIVLGELRVGFRLGGRPQENEAELAEFLGGSAVRTLDVNAESADLYADIVVDLRRAGTPVPTNDVWIAALAAQEGAAVVTYDDHFTAIRRVGLRLLPKP